MQQVAKKYYSPKQYLALEEAADHKSEYYQGEIFAMAGGSINHNRIAGNLFEGLRHEFRGRDCEVFMSTMRIWVERAQLFTYPDLVVVCGEARFYEDRDDTITNIRYLSE